MSKLKRPRQELRAELHDQIALLRHSCSSFDQGLEPIGRHIALSLRVLLHHRNRSRALLEQLKLRDGHYVDSAGPISTTNLLAECNLVLVQITASARSQGANYKAICQSDVPPRTPRKVPFAEWWLEPVLKDAAGVKFSRLDLVSHVADTDGGAHVDPELDKEYAEMSRIHGLSWNFFAAPQETGQIRQLQVEGRLEFYCIRQIAWELLETLRSRAPEFFGNEEKRGTDHGL